MTKRRARLNDDNDPLSSTDKVLAGFEQIGKSTSQQDEVSTSKEADKSTSQQDEVPTSKEADKSTSQQSKSEYTSEASTGQQDNTPTIQPNSNSTSQKANLLTSQQVNVEKVSLRKSTFQISEEVLHQLDKLHLTLQLELGKANAPYKEVIVEEALVQLLESFNSERTALIEVLMSRQKSRDKL
ncbi:hypothetical protein H6G97_36355 [Nostoc flagelliforme FACHB-838]|jgi:hypothetical protein|uniref:Uncharacterized protein n=1 Tax=Nostoc flagelliforme FACHB-838 TaxID=2692904 RepID=A0ABR8E242_9NOSO|nr:hypothetical protein [Nostoc flagelliforme]MBD2534658.1 hypothetical protein [Nostoc flagelliforme FACHB-838]